MVNLCALRNWQKLRWVISGGLSYALFIAIAACGLAGCSSAVLIDNLPAAVGGEPASIPARAETPPQYLPVHDIPPPRDFKLMSDDEVKKRETDLLKVRDRQEASEGRSPDQNNAPNNTNVVNADANKK